MADTEYNALNVESLTGFKISDIIGLTGIYGIREKNIRVKFEGNSPQLQITILCEGITLVRIIDFKNLFIQNLAFKNSTPRQGIGAKVLKAQSEQARKFGFTTIYCYATGQKGSFYSGYIAWAKLGYSMYHDDDISYFGSVASKGAAAHPTHKTIFSASNVYNLVKHQVGSDYWTDEGLPWFAKFETEEKSENNKNLSEYFESK